MSWSVQVIGKGAALVAKLNERFDQAEAGTASIPEEQALVRQARQLALDGVKAIEGIGARVEAYGSLYRQTPEIKYSSIKVEVSPQEVAV